MIPLSLNGMEHILEKARAFFDDSRGSHGWDHTLRVCRLCERIGPAENADMDVLRVAAVLHDIGRRVQDAANGAVCHAVEGAAMAHSVVMDLPLSHSQKDNTLHCIRSHRFRGENIPRTCEARVLFDADKLDAIGAVGVARAYLFAGEIGARLHNRAGDVTHTQPYSREDTGYREFMVKLCRIKERMMTETGKKMARDRHAFMEGFFRRFLEEYEGRM